jgi:peptide-methionine (S)-S-oxide reductase
MAQARAILAGGCFWGMEALFRELRGVLDTTVGYTGGHVPHPTYEKHDGHAEAIEIIYDDTVLSYDALLRFFFQIHDPTTLNRQGNDRGTSYRSAIFYATQQEKSAAQRMIATIDASGKWGGKVVTEVTPLSWFYPAEEYHQDYLQKHPHGYTCHFIRPEWTV